MTIEALIESHRLPQRYAQTVEDIIKPLAAHIADLHSSKSRPLLINVNGSQGSGKSTIVCFLQWLLQNSFDLPTANLSLDDFYLTRAERQQLARDVHPLLITRGVPGTHDLPLMAAVIQGLLDGQSVSIPRFNKAIDDRADNSQWTTQSPVQIVLFEGWCNGCPVQPENLLDSPVNELEADEDAQAIWRHYANDALGEYHQQIFSHTDLMVMLQVPGFETVFSWRALQEQKLRENTSGQTSTHVMNEAQLRRFIQHYQRLTSWGLETLPNGLADILLPVDADHQITAILKKTADGYQALIK